MGTYSGNPYSQDNPQECEAHGEWEAEQRELRDRYMPVIWDDKSVAKWADEKQTGEEMSKHTPGPWEVCNGTDVFTAPGGPRADGLCASHNDGWQIADCEVGLTFDKAGKEHFLPSYEQSDNARLIAAAPDLLAACEAVADEGLCIGPEYAECGEAAGMVLAAIKKAKEPDSEN